MNSRDVSRAHLEAELERFFYKRVKLMGGYPVKNAPTEAGVPDRMVLFFGTVYLVELKQVGEDLSPIQRIWHSRAAERYGVRPVVLHGKAEVLDWIRDVVAAAGPKSRAPRTRVRAVG